MAYSQSKKLTAQEKKLTTVRTQLYGKEQPESYPVKVKEAVPFRSGASDHEISYLKKDLQKIAVLTSIVLSAQVLLWFVVKNKI